MRFSLTTKLAAALFGMSAVMVALVVLWAGWALDERFSTYVGAAALARLDRTAAALEQAFLAEGDWSSVSGHREVWEAALCESEPPRPPMLPLDDPPNGPPPDSGPDGWRLGGPPGPPPAGFPPGPPGPPPGFAHRWLHGELTLVDTSERVVAGDSRAPRGAARRLLIARGVPVGALLFVPERLPGDIEAAFLTERVRDLCFAAAVALALSGLWAVLLARYILTPVRLVTAGARLLAEGTFSTRIDAGRRDELGDLVRDFNKLAAALEAAEQARRSWVADTSHELRTPLAVLRAQIEALQDGVHEAGVQSLGRLHGEVQRMSRLVDDLHELARADGHALGLRLETVRPSDIMAEVLSRFKPRWDDCGLHLDTTALGQSSALALVDPDRLRQVFVNLVENAIRYTHPGGMVRVSETRATGSIMIKVEDTAPGVPGSKLPRLFERFFRVDGSRSRQTGGSGLGLAICKAIVEAHAGTISAAPSPLGGLAVTVTLPTARRATA